MSTNLSKIFVARLIGLDVFDPLGDRLGRLRDVVVLLRPGESTESAGYTWTLEGLHGAVGPNFAARVATLRVAREGRTVTVLHPERRFFPTQRTTTTEAAIRTDGFADIYAVLGEERDGAAVMRLHYNPLAPWIWLGALVMAVGGSVSLLDRRTRVGAPARAKAARPAPAAA